MSAKVLVILANAFPFGNWEPYLETEARHWADFDRVLIFSLSVRSDQLLQRRALADSRIEVFPVTFRSRTFYAMNAITALVHREFYREIRQLAARGEFTISRLITLFVFLSRLEHEGRAIRRILKEELTDEDQVVFYAYRFAYQPYMAAMLADDFPKSLVLARAHGSDLYEERSPRGYLPLRQQNARSVTQVHAVSEHGADYLLNRVPNAQGTVRVTYLGSQDHGLGPLPGSRAPFRLLTCSTIVPIKRLDRLVDALAQIRELPIEWTHFGDGPGRGELERLVRERLGDNITCIFRGMVDNHEMMAALAQEPFHVLVNVSDSEGVPVSMMEACSFGIPIIATDVGGVREIVTDGDNGRLIPATVGDTTTAIREMVALPEAAYASMRSRARAVWDQRFNAERNYTGFWNEAIRRLEDAELKAR